MRLVNLVPFNLTHEAMADLQVGGYKVPRGTAVVPQVVENTKFIFDYSNFIG